MGNRPTLRPTIRRRGVPRGITLMADGYEILRPVKGMSIALGTDALMGKPALTGQMFPGYRLTREVFNAYRAAGWIQKIKPYVAKGWQAWGITAAGREEARMRPKPSAAEIRAARTASSAVGRAQEAGHGA